MPTKREREYYAMGFKDGFMEGSPVYEGVGMSPEGRQIHLASPTFKQPRKPKRKLSAWNKYVKANSKKPRFRYRNGKLNLKKMAVAFRKTPAGKKRKR